MSVVIRKITGQTREFLSLVEGTKKIAAVDNDGKYFGDASRITGILKPFQPQPLVVDDDSSGTASDNAETIQAALNAAANDFEIDTIKLPNAKFFCDQIKLGFVKTGALEIERFNHSGLTIEGGGKTFVINKYHPAGLGVFFGSPYVIGYIDRMDEYQPGEPDQTEVRITSADPDVGLSQYEAGDLMYAFPRYYQQKIANSRDCQLNKIVSITPATGSITVTLEDALATDIQARLATATVGSGHVTAVTLDTFDVGAMYDAEFEPRAVISGDGEEAEAICLVNSGSLTGIDITAYGSGYTSVPTVTIGAPPGGGTQATGHANVNASNQVVSISIDNPGNGYRAPPSVTIGGPGSGAAATARIVGLLTSVVVTNQGKGYTTATVAIDPPPLFAKWVKNARRVSDIGDDFIVVDPVEDADFYPIDSYVWLCIGSAYDESDGHYYRVRDLDAIAGIVYVTEAIRPEDYIAGQTCLLRGPFLENLTIRNINCGGFEAYFGGNWIINFQNTVNLQIESVQMLSGGPDKDDNTLVSGNFGTYKSQYIHFRSCLGRIENQATHNLSAVDCLLNDYITHSHCTDAVFYHCRISQYDGPFSALGSGTVRFAFRDCEFNFPTTRIVAPEGKEIAFENCRVVYTADPWSFDGPEIRFKDVNFVLAPNGALTMSDNCKYCVLEHLTTPDAITLASLSGGFYSNVSPEPTPPASWRAVLRLMEVSAPSTPPTDTGVIYVRDIAGKSELCAVFHTGAVQVIATEP